MNAIALQYNDNISVNFTNDAWFNATEVASSFGKRPIDWLNLESTQQYISDLCEIFKCEESSLLKTKRGRHDGGSWFSPKLSIPFARWLDSKFAIWCDMQIDNILHTQPQSHQLPEPPTRSAINGCLTRDQQDVIKALVKERAEALPKEMQAGATIRCWSAIKKKFGCSYKEVSAENFVNVISLLSRLPLEGELLAAPEQSTLLPVDLKTPQGLQQITFKFLTEGYSHGRWFMSLSDGVFNIRMMDNAEMSMTEAQWVNYMVKERGYIVVKKTEVAEKLMA